MLATSAGGGGGGDAEATPFGFEVPLGDPGQIEAAGRACATWATAMSTRAGDVRSGALAAADEWTGLAESQFTAFAAHLVSVYTALGDAVQEAGTKLSTFATELESAQRATRQALSDCESCDGEVQAHNREADAHGDTVSRLIAQQPTAVTPHASAELTSQISQARDQQAAAAHAASVAEGELQAAQRRGDAAWSEYQMQAQAIASALEGLGSRIERVQALPAAARSAATAGAGVQNAGFWPAFAKAAGSDAVGVRVGLIGELAERYRETDMVAPIGKAAEHAMQGFGDELHDGGFIASDRLEAMIARSQQGDYFQPGVGKAVPKGEAEWAMPDWAEGLSRGMMWGGAALTFGSTGYDTWEQDEHDHPNWSTTHKVLDTTQKTAVVGGLTVGGAYAGAVAGGEAGGTVGFVVGEAVDPLGGGVVGGAVGGVVGGVYGGIKGAHLGTDVGEALEAPVHTAHAVVHDVKEAWDWL